MNRVDNWKKLASPEPCVVCGLDTWAMRDTCAVHMHCSTWGVCLDDRTTRAVNTSDLTVAGERVATWEYWGERRDEANAWEHVRIYSAPPWISTFFDIMNNRGPPIGHTHREVDEAIDRITGRGFPLGWADTNQAVVQHDDLNEVIVRHGGHIDDDGEIVWPRGGFVDAIGQWPGDESDDEVNAGLRDVE